MRGIICFLCGVFCVFLNAQHRDFVLIDIQNKKEWTKKDSISAVAFLDSLVQNNYYFTQIFKIEEEDNKVKIYFDKGENFNQAKVKLSPILAEEFKQYDTFLVKNLDSLRAEINNKYIDKGFIFSRVKTRYLGMENHIPKVEISVSEGQKRKINGFQYRGYTRMPTRFKKNLEKDFIGETYDNNTLSKIHQNLKNHIFVSLERPPQIHFTKDSTQVFLFLQKKKVNTFDGIIGFGNNESQKFSFNGTLHLNLQNVFNGFENLSLYWQRSPDKTQNFDLKWRVPYLFKSNLGVDMHTNIYRQGSTFANVKFLPSFFYNLSERQKIGIRGSFEISTVLDSLYTSAKDFNRNGLGLWYEYQQLSEVDLFINDFKIRAEVDFLSTFYDKEATKARTLRYWFSGEKNFHLTGKHYINIKAESAILHTEVPLSTNELFRIGGWNSLRGFNENSILSNFYAYGGAEYRYLVDTSTFFDVFAQYGQIKNKNLNIQPQFYSVGLGFNFFLPIGQMSFQISNGSQIGDPFRFKETKIHWGILSRF